MGDWQAGGGSGPLGDDLTIQGELQWTPGLIPILCQSIPPYPIPQAQLEAGVTFKKSTAKGMPELDFVPVNLHIQQMKVGRGEEEKGGS